MRAPTPSDGRPARLLDRVLALWLAGVALRVTILAVPPVIPLIRTEFGMSETQVGILTGLPPVLFAVSAVLASLFIARLGALATVIAGILATAVGSALRGVAPDVAVLYAATIVTGFGVAIMQPSLPPLVRAWLPDRVGFGTAVFTNGLLVGEIIPVALTLPLLLPLLGGSWRWSFVVWAVPVALIAGVIAAIAPKNVAYGGKSATSLWWPDWSDPLIWRLGFILGAANAMYFTANAFLPDYLHYVGRPDLVSAALIALNLGQIPASLLLLLVAGRMERRVWPYVASGLVSLLGIGGIMVGGAWIVVSAAVLGFAAAATLILALALPSLLSPADDVHRVTAAMFTISYSTAVLTPIVSGLAWDLTGVAPAAFVPLALCAVVLIVLAPSVAFDRGR